MKGILHVPWERGRADRLVRYPRATSHVAQNLQGGERSGRANDPIDRSAADLAYLAQSMLDGYH